ncbi:MAG: sarcosine oxidase subunit delta [Pseudomonadota bacterium]
MRIHCPHCGQRDLVEYTYHGDARNELSRPDPAQPNSQEWNRWVYDRENPAGDHAEIWQHTGGCRMFLRATRNTVTHEIKSTEALR